MKKILFCIVILILIVIIGIKVNYKSNIIFCLGNNMDGDYIYHYQETRIEDIINDIDNNIEIGNRYIQNILVKANYIYFDLNNLSLNKYSINKIELLLEKIRFYTKEKIVVILRKEKTQLDKAINNWIFKLDDKYDIMIKR